MKPKTLEEIWVDQADFNRNFVRYEQLVTDELKEQWVHKYIAALQREATELLDKTNYKVHRLRRKPLDLQALYEEGIDVFKYWLSVMQVLGMTPEQFLEAYYRKSEIVRDRWRRELVQLRDTSKVAVLDLDDVLSRFSEDWLIYLSQHTGSRLSGVRYEDYTTFYVSECLPISRDIEEELKAKFLQTQLASIRPMENAEEVVETLKRNGYTIAVVTGRPVHTYYDTASWLQAHHIPYDLLIWGEDKADTIYNELAPAVPAFVVEDKPSTIQKLRSSKYVTYVMDRPYNRSMDGKSGEVERIFTLYELLEKLGVG